MKLGKYKHYKNKDYEVLFIGKHSDTLEDLVVYKALYNSEEFGDNAIWIRSLKDFEADLIVDDKKVARFRYVGE